MPFWLPTNTRPPAIVGCAQATVASGKPNAHFSVRRGTSAAVSLAWSAGWKRVFVGSCSTRSIAVAETERRRTMRCCSVPSTTPLTSPDIVLPVMNSAIARRSAPLSRDPWTRIAPVTRTSMIDSGVLGWSAARAGARESAAALWQLAHARANRAAPSGACARAGMRQMPADRVAIATRPTPGASWRRSVASPIRSVASDPEFARDLLPLVRKAPRPPPALNASKVARRKSFLSRSVIQERGSSTRLLLYR